VTGRHDEAPTRSTDLQPTVRVGPFGPASTGTRNFHPIGNVWSRAYRDGGLPENGDFEAYADRNIQIMTVPPGSCMIGGMETPVPERIKLVDHALSRVARRGMLAEVDVLGDERSHPATPVMIAERDASAMPTAKLAVTLPSDIWIADLSTRFPEATFRVLAALTDENTGIGLVEIAATGVGDVLACLDGADGVRVFETLYRGDDRALVQFETSMPLLLFPVQGSGVPLEMPFTLSNGQAVWEISAPQERLSELGEQLEEFGISFSVDRIQQHLETEQVLTESQLELVQEAIDAGYYDTPRECTLTELAEEGEVDGECHAPPRGGDGRHGVRGRAPRRDARRTVNSGLEGQHRPETAENTSARRDAVLLEHRVKQVEKLRFGLEGPLRERVHGLRQRDAPSRPVVRDVGIAERPDDFVAGRRILEVGVIEMADQCGDAEFDRIR